MKYIQPLVRPSQKGRHLGQPALGDDENLARGQHDLLHQGVAEAGARVISGRAVDVSDGPWHEEGQGGEEGGGGPRHEDLVGGEEKAGERRLVVPHQEAGQTRQLVQGVEGLRVTLAPHTDLKTSVGQSVNGAIDQSIGLSAVSQSIYRSIYPN